jgi:hypothetical protein
MIYAFYRTVTACFCFIIMFSALALNAQTDLIYDIVLNGGRVIDPETKLDAVRNVGIMGGRIMQIGTEPLKGKETINASGLVISPGFIDLHIHGRSNKEQEYQVHDGVTTALEMEWGVAYLKEWYASRQSKALINYGASVNWPFERSMVIDGNSTSMLELREATIKGTADLESMFNIVRPTYTINLNADQSGKMLENIRSTLSDGALGIGLPVGYLPKVNPAEVYKVFQLAAEKKVTIFSHVRENNIFAIQEVITDAILTGASLHIVHINSSSLSQLPLSLSMVSEAQKKGFDITTELYPYPAASTLLQSSLFDEGWQEKMNISYGDLQWVATGERLTKETFDKYRKSGGVVIIYAMKPEWIRTGIAAPGVMIASDGMLYAKLAHPRTAGTFSRVLGKYVREDKVLNFPEAVEKMTLLPAKTLEGISPAMRGKGRIQVGADADITIFDPATVIDKASFDKGLEFSGGIEYVIVNGTVVIRNGKTVANVFPGKPVYGKYKN